MNMNMNMNSNPQLIESGTRYFLRETLKNCNKKRTKYYNDLTNLGLLIGFFIIVSSIVYYKYTTRPTEESRKQKETLKQTYILSKIQALTNKKFKDQNQIITNLPKFESDFVKLHENFFKT